jgi:two-component system response regulator HydG
VRISIQKDNLEKRLVRQKDDTEINIIIDALEQCKHSKTDTAKLLNISRKTLFNKMKKHGME